MSNNEIEFSILAKDNFSKVMKVAAVAMGAITTAAGFTAKALVNVGSENEKMRVRMTAMLGSAAEANAVFDDMTKFASKVPFAYEDIMQSATTLSGVLKGGQEEINQYMPMIADLAAVSGLSIQETTDQIVRMYSAGAGAADLFRERGINAMLGFEAGVSYSAEETMRKVNEAFDSETSKFKGASVELATTWEGVVSMIGDKYRAIKVQIADAGIFNYIKAIAMGIDKLMGDALDNSAKNAGKWSNYLIDGIRTVMNAVGTVTDSFAYMSIMWKWLKMKYFELWVLPVTEGMYEIGKAIDKVNKFFGGDGLDGLEEFYRKVLQTRIATAELASEYEQGVIDFTKPSESIESFMELVEMNFANLQAKSAEIANAVAAPIIETHDKVNELMAALGEEYPNWLEWLRDNNEQFAHSFFGTITKGIDALSKGVADVLVSGKKVGDMLKGVAELVLKSFISMLVKIGIQRLILAGINKTATMSEASTQAGASVALAGSNAIASTALAPWPINLTAPAVGAGMAAAAATTYATGFGTGSGLAIGLTGAAHGGLDSVPSESTYLLDKGERVLSPNQNKDLTSFLESNNGGAVTIENLQIDILPNATNADALLNMSDSDMEDLVADKVIRALNALKRKGIAPDYA